MKNSVKFVASEAGAVSVDWVVLTAGLVGLGLATMGVVSNGVEDLSTDVSNELMRDGIVTSVFEQEVQQVAKETAFSAKKSETTSDTFSTTKPLDQNAYDLAFTEAKQNEAQSNLDTLGRFLDEAKAAIADNDPKKAAERLSYAAAFGNVFEAQKETPKEQYEFYTALVADYEKQFAESKKG